ncbi:Cyclin-B1-2, partial [Mucuna pruriens]
MVSLFYAFHCYVVMFSLMKVTMRAHYRASDYMKSQHEINKMVKDFIKYIDNAYYKNHILSIGKAILKRLEWYLTVSTPCLSLIIRDFGQTDQQMENMVFFLAELGLVHYQTTILFLPIMTATTALYAARCIINRRPILKHKLPTQDTSREDLGQHLSIVQIILVSYQDSTQELTGGVPCQGYIFLVVPPHACVYTI